MLDLDKTDRLVASRLEKYQLAKKIREQLQDQADVASQQEEATREAQAIIQRLAQSVQTQVHSQISTVVTRCLNAVFESIEEAIENSDVIFICCENEYLRKIISKLKSVNLEGKILIDCTNSALYKIFDCNTALIRTELRNVPLFKAFNNLGLDYPKSDILGVVKETYFCGENGIEKSKVKRLIELIGYRAIDSGGLDNALLLEAFYHLRKEITTIKNEQSDYHFKLISC